MKKILVTTFGMILAVTLAFGASEASASKSAAATLLTNETSKSTSRVTASQHMTFNVVNTGKYNITYRIFKNGVATTGYRSVVPGQRVGEKVTGKAQYSIRMYCGSSSGKGCQASAGLIAH